jgi:uncharacterized membrane protein YqaE (UPF0057 family)
MLFIETIKNDYSFIKIKKQMKYCIRLMLIFTIKYQFMKKISTLFIATICAAILTNAAFGASIVIVPETTTPATDVTATTEGIFTNPESPLPDAITLKSAVDDFKSLSRAERRDRIKEAKVAFKEFKKEKKAGKAEDSSNRLLEIIVTILLPPVGVLIHQGKVDGKFWIDLILTLLFYIPGLIYGLIVVLGD